MNMEYLYDTKYFSSIDKNSETKLMPIKVIFLMSYPIFKYTLSHEGPEREQMYSSTLPSTSALDGGGWSTPLPGRLTSGKELVPIV